MEHWFQVFCLAIIFAIISLVFFQDRDLERLRRKWLNALTKRQEYLDQQLQKLVSKHGRKSKLNIYPPSLCIINLYLQPHKLEVDEHINNGDGKSIGMFLIYVLSFQNNIYLTVIISFYRFPLTRNKERKYSM